jgi:hypothetical protein
MAMKPSSKTILLSLGTCAVGILVGRLSVSESPAQRGATERRTTDLSAPHAATVTSVEPATVYSNDPGITAFLQNYGLDRRQAISKEQMLEAIHESLREPDPVRSHFLFARLMEELTPESAPEIQSMIRSTLRGEDAAEYLRMLAHRWGSLDPQGALAAFSKPGESSRRGLSTVLAGWASKSPEEAVKWLDEYKGEHSESLRLSLISSIAATNPELSSAYAAKLTNPKDKIHAAQDIFGEIFRTKGEAEAQAWMKGLADPEMKRGAFSALTDQAIDEGNLQKAISLVREHAGQDYTKSAASDIAAALSAKDVDQGLQFANSLPAGAQERAFREVVEQWMERGRGKDSLAASEYVKNLPAGPTRDAGAVAIAREIVREDPASAIAWVNVIQEPESKQRALQEVAKQYLRTDPQQAAAWLPTSGLSPEALQQFYQRSGKGKLEKSEKAERKLKGQKL